jgi:putative transcriptional regulator
MNSTASFNVPVRITLDAMLSRREMTGKHLATRMGISETQLSLFRSGKVRGIRFSTMARMCAVLKCQPGDVLAYDFEEADLRELEDE